MKERAKDLAGQVVVIIGAARGIGALVARRLAARDARVALLGLEPGELASVSARCGPHSRWWEVDADENAALREVSAGLPFPVGRTSSFAPAVDALVHGIARRAPRVYGQRWLPPMQLTRGIAPLIVARFAAAATPEIESRWLATGAGSYPLGAGGAADTKARAAPVAASKETRA